jgi:predicted transposase/invertase (TIGR01784 family)
MSINREYKNNLFTTLFSDAEKLLSLYNALADSDLPSDTAVEIATLEDVFFNYRRNDIAFVLDDRIVILIEHQSTISANMPLRLLIYAARVYEKLIDNRAVYKSKLLKIPKPYFIVLYNGPDKFPDEKTLRLSDAYRETPEALAGFNGSLELEVRVVNINKGRNEATVKKSDELYGYVRFVEKVREYQKAGLDLAAVITRALNDCIKEGILADFFKAHSSEVINMLTAEWDINIAKEVWKQEAWEDGLEEGLEKGLEKGREEGLEKGREEKNLETVIEMKNEGLTDDVIARVTKLPIEKIREIHP